MTRQPATVAVEKRNPRAARLPNRIIAGSGRALVLLLEVTHPVFFPGEVGLQYSFQFRRIRRTIIDNDGFEIRKSLRKNGIQDRKSTRLNSSHLYISYAVFCLK